MFYLMTHSEHFIYGYTALEYGKGPLSKQGDLLLSHGLFFPISSKVLLYVSSHREDNTYHGLCYTRRGALAGTRNSSMDLP